jgi:hypothetical protein
LEKNVYIVEHMIKIELILLLYLKVFG